MSKYHKINWREEDTQELNRVVRNFNAKIQRLSKSNPKISNLLPEKVSANELKNLIYTRQDLKRELNALKRFSKRGSETIVEIQENDYGLKITKWQRSEMNRRVAVINRRRKNRLDKLSNVEMKSGGQALGYTKGDIGMGRATEVTLSPMNAFTRRMTQTDLKKKWENIVRESQSDYFTKRDFMLRDNYIKSLNENFNPEDMKEIVKTIEKMDIKDFLDTFIEEGEMFEFSYPPDREKYEAYVKHIRSIWIK